MQYKVAKNNSTANASIAIAAAFIAIAAAFSRSIFNNSIRNKPLKQNHYNNAI